MQFRVLGALEAVDANGAPVDLGGRQPRVVVALLLAAAGSSVSPDALIDSLWGDDPPASATGTLQSYISRLRRKLDATPARVVWDEFGYRLDVPPGDVDFRRFEQLAADGRALLHAGRLDEAREALVAAEALWRGPAFAEVADLDGVRGLAVRLDEQRGAALEDRVTADLELGRHAAVVGELAALVVAHPLRERLHELLALALYRSGRQAEALRALATAGRA